MKVREIEAKNYKYEQDKIARIEIEIGSKKYYSLEHYGQEKGLNPTVLSRRLKAYKEVVGSYEGMTEHDLVKGSRSLFIKGSKYRNMRQYLRMLGLMEYEGKIRQMMMQIGTDYKNLLTKSQQVQLAVDRFYFKEAYNNIRSPEKRRYLDSVNAIKPQIE